MLSKSIDLGFLDELSGEWREEVMEFLRCERREFSDELMEEAIEHGGTEFARAVLREMAKIPYGEVRSYGELALRAGYPRAARAVGTVCRNNRYPIIIPCHRVVGSNGIGGYSFGLQMKRELLRLEGVSF
ncbi:MGMT family protein [Candidatus Saccharibacteria bacterium]|nr:MGMT family protein [Candidatus Saccharibacteria bacterium]